MYFIYKGGGGGGFNLVKIWLSELFFAEVEWKIKIAAMTKSQWD